MTRKPTGRKPGRPRPDTVTLKKISLEADPVVLKRFDRWAKAHGLSRSAMFRRVLNELDFTTW